MIIIMIFVILLLLAAGYAQWRGGAPERLAAAALVIAMVTTMCAGVNGATFQGVQWELLVIDFGLFVVLCAIALFADRFWPMWLAAFQMVAVASHGASAYNSNVLPVAYWWIVGKISYPMIVILAVGILRHDRRKRAGFPEVAWSWQRRAIRTDPGDI